jgi:hypothetical protein
MASMRNTMIVALVLLAGCSTVGTGGITTQSRIYTTEFDKVPPQATVDRCQQVGQVEVTRYGVGGGLPAGGEGWVRGGNAYEKCMVAAGYRPR